MKVSLSRHALALLLVCLSGGPGAVRGVESASYHRHRPTAREIWTRTELYFGSDRHSGIPVSESDFAQFVDREITPKFPDGLTMFTCSGRFLDGRGVVEKERSMVLILLYPLSASDANEKITQIRDSYKKKFKQESVLRVDSLSYVSF